MSNGSDAGEIYDSEAIQGLLERAVAERGEDFIYPDQSDADSPWRLHAEAGVCRYARADTGEPACIVGLVLSYIGLFDVAKANEGKGIYQFGVELPITAGGLRMLQRAQGTQDSGASWGVALKRALVPSDRYLEDVL